MKQLWKGRGAGPGFSRVYGQHLQQAAFKPGVYWLCWLLCCCGSLLHDGTGSGCVVAAARHVTYYVSCGYMDGEEVYLKGGDVLYGDILYGAFSCITHARPQHAAGICTFATHSSSKREC